jgi:hypothetical protein
MKDIDRTQSAVNTDLASQAEPLWGSSSFVHKPRVARSSQPWAGGRNPFGIVGRLTRASLKRGVNETSALQLELSIFNSSDLLTLREKLSLLTRFWRWTAELVELTNLNLQQNN